MNIYKIGLNSVQNISCFSIVYWLNNLEKESNIKEYVLIQSQIEYIWEHFGGSIWEISSLLGRILRVCRDGKVEDTDLEKIVEGYIVQAKSYFKEYAGLDDSRSELLKEINKNVQGKGHIEEQDLSRLLKEDHYPDRHTLQEELNNLVRQNYLYYNPTRAEYKLQGKSMEIGLRRYVQEIAS